jgi:hypothetical protein
MSDEEYTCDPGYCQSLELYDHIKALTEELTVAEQRGYANAMEAERKLHEDRIEALTTERDEQIEWVKRLADMQIASEAKLAKAVELLRRHCDPMDMSDADVATLAEIEGEKG